MECRRYNTVITLLLSDSIGSLLILYTEYSVYSIYLPPHYSTVYTNTNLYPILLYLFPRISIPVITLI
jgi:hypothetical protein